MNKNNIKISVIIPLYNGGDHIVKCLTELDRQSMDHDYEVIIVDDASTDNSFDIVSNTIKTLNHANAFRLIKNVQNGRAGKARNTGIKEAYGEYVVFVDQDDYPDVTFLEKLYLLTENSKYDCTACNIKDKNGDYIIRAFADHKESLSINDKIELMRNFGYTFAIMIRKTILSEYGLCYPENVLYEDCLFNNGIMGCISSINTTKEVLYYREYDCGSQTASFSKAKIYDRIKATNYQLNKYKSIEKMEPFMEQNAQCAFYFVFLSPVWWMIILPDLYDKELFEHCLKEGKALEIDWNKILNSETQLKKFSLHILKRVYFHPSSFGILHYILSRLYRVKKNMKTT